MKFRLSKLCGRGVSIKCINKYEILCQPSHIYRIFVALLVEVFFFPTFQCHTSTSLPFYNVVSTSSSAKPEDESAFRMSKFRRPMHVSQPECPALRYVHLRTVEKFHHIKQWATAQGIYMGWFSLVAFQWTRLLCRVKIYSRFQTCFFVPYL